MKKRMNNWIYADDEDYPKLLKQIPDSLKGLYCLGNSSLLIFPKLVAVVGSRKMSSYGKKVVGMLVPELVKREVVVVSGMALGVDAEVHRVCLECGGKTIAVLASGVDVVSPKSNGDIYESILKKDGLIISEYSDGRQASRVKFLERNRIVAGLCSIVIIVEGGKRSGTLVTARLALDYGREVWAVPGRIDDENSWTPNYLINNGAVPVFDIDDMISQI